MFNRLDWHAFNRKSQGFQRDVLDGANLLDWTSWLPCDVVYSTELPIARRMFLLFCSDVSQWDAYMKRTKKKQIKDKKRNETDDTFATFKLS